MPLSALEQSIKEISPNLISFSCSTYSSVRKYYFMAIISLCINFINFLWQQDSVVKFNLISNMPRLRHVISSQPEKEMIEHLITNLPKKQLLSFGGQYSSKCSGPDLESLLSHFPDLETLLVRASGFVGELFFYYSFFLFVLFFLQFFFW